MIDNNDISFTMEFVRLFASLALPWLGAFCWLAVLERKFNPHPPPDLARQVAYALFLGLAGVQALVLIVHRLTGSVDFWPILDILFLLSVPGALLFLSSASPLQKPYKAK
ncbi:MAG: hypothetical protein ACJAYC_000225 [Halieaceae bacterium]|jgi:hypothetical protein